MISFPFFKKKPFFTAAEQQQIVEAVRAAETQTSGEIRVYVESRCRYVNPLDRAAEVFYGLKMENTDARNAALVYVALKDRQLALYGDKGIHEKVGNDFWDEKVRGHSICLISTKKITLTDSSALSMKSVKLYAVISRMIKTPTKMNCPMILCLADKSSDPI